MKLVFSSYNVTLSPHYVNLVFEKNLGTSPPSPVASILWKNFLVYGKIFWGEPKFFISPPNQKPLGTALLTSCISFKSSIR